MFAVVQVTEGWRVLVGKIYSFGQPRGEAVTKFKKLFLGEKVEWSGEQIINQGYGQKIRGTFAGISFSVIIYYNKKNYSTKIMVEKGSTEFTQRLGEHLQITNGAQKEETARQNSSAKQTMLVPVSHIGTDEAGKGDYFGPLVVAGFFVEINDVPLLQELGVADSKTITDQKIRLLAEKIRLAFPDKYNLVIINPQKYNELYAKINNLNKLLAWAHARVIENLLQKIVCTDVLVDQFGQERFVQEALLEKGRQIKVWQLTHAEEDLAVAAASILARDAFLTKMKELAQRYELPFPKGCGPGIKKSGREFLVRYGSAEMAKVAKLHFKTTKEIMV